MTPPMKPLAGLLSMILPGWLWMASGLSAQPSPQAQRALDPSAPSALPAFIDRDGDGINDWFQRGLGLRQKQQVPWQPVMWYQGTEKTTPRPVPIDTDNDGSPDMLMVDLDGDGVAETPFREHMRKQYQMLDRNADGIPDPITMQELRQHMQVYQEWRRSVRNRIREGLPPFIDENRDGIPDDLPEELMPPRGTGNGLTTPGNNPWNPCSAPETNFKGTPGTGIRKQIY